MGLAIVAIPEEQDRVWKISSEKVPHLTLLFLGDANNSKLEQIVQFVEHAVTLSEHGPFYLDVERRGELGPDNADVVFFSKRSWNLRWIKQFRSQLLQNADVKTAYDSTEQYDEWTPHLTLGYPETPAKADPNDEPFGHPLYSVCFDRIAVWTGDFDGPDFQLEWPDRELEGDLALMYADEQKAKLMHDGLLLTPSPEMLVERGSEFVEHHGVKGMQWGVRNAPTGVGTTSHTTKVALAGNLSLLSSNLREHTSGDTKVKVGLFGQYALLSGKVRADLKQASKKTDLAKADNEWEKGLNNGHAWVAVQNKLADHFNQHIDAVNAKHASDKDWSHEDYNHPERSSDPQFRAYVKDVHTLTKDSIQHASDSLHLENPSGTKKVKVEQDPNDPLTFRMGVEQVKHAADSGEIEFKVKIETDAKGRATGFKIDEGADVNAVHGAMNGADPVALGEAFILEHFGIKGMRWGFRKDRPATPLASTTGHSLIKGKAKIKVEGGEHHPAHDDAVKVAVATTKLKKSGTAALSNQELKEVANRLQLENQVSLLTSNKGKRWVQKQFDIETSNLARQGVREGIKRGAKRGAKAAGVAAALA